MKGLRAAIVMGSGLAVAAIGSVPCSTYGQDTATGQALAEIIETANQICQAAPLEQTNQGVSLSGDANAKVGGLVGKIADLGISGAAQYQTGHSLGVLQKDLIVAIQSGNNCKLEVFRTLEKDLIRGRNSGPSTGDITPNVTPPAVTTTSAAGRIPPSFPCERASKAVEMLICGNSHLAQLDVQLANAYHGALTRLPSASQQELKRDEYYWLQQRDACQRASDMIACVETAYSTRLSRLAQY
jgi:uncharacterized protein YecT (DUF1311 family)